MFAQFLDMTLERRIQWFINDNLTKNWIACGQNIDASANKYVLQVFEIFPEVWLILKAVFAILTLIFEIKFKFILKLLL